MAGLARISDLAWAIVEPKGRISFIPKDSQDQQSGDNDQDVEV